ncbi:MAG: hypothetical protein HY823_05835 [Acidobacteria bacterium]|nr:hypothetical protein [Acidobacteriota bacterium]
MSSFELARQASEHLRAHRDLEGGAFGTLLALLGALWATAAFPAATGFTWILGQAAWLLLVPWVLRRILPVGRPWLFRLGMAAFPANALLLGLWAFLESAKIPPFEVEELPALRWLFPILSLLLPCVYLVLQFPEWRRKALAAGACLRALRSRPDPRILGELSGLSAAALSGSPDRVAPWAAFRSVPARPGNWRRFLRLDTERHGEWRVAFSDGFALVMFHDGSRMEAVPRGGLRVAAEDLPTGEKPGLCLARWNSHLHEGRITAANLEKIQAWNHPTVPGKG